MSGQPAETPPLGAKAYHVSDFMRFDGEDFLDNAYRIILGRPLDDGGRNRFLRPLRSGRMSRVELLARLRLSKEGRRRAVPVGGHLAIRGMVHALFSVPVVGYPLALANYALKLPVLARTLEMTQADVRLARNGLTTDLRLMEERLAEVIAQGDQRCVQDLSRALGAKVDKEPFWELSGQKVGHDELKKLLTATQEEVQELRGAKVDVAEYREFRRTAVDFPRLWSLLRAKVDRPEFAQALAEKLDLSVYDRGIAELSTACWNAIDGKLDIDVYDKRKVENLRTHTGDTEQEPPVELYWRALSSKVDKDWIFARQSETRDAIHTLEALQQRIAGQLQQQKATLLDQHRRIDLLLRELRSAVSDSSSSQPMAKVVESINDHWLDAHYVNFEDVFRGSREDIKARAEVYLPIVRAASAGNGDRRVIDIGCGRGELLELLTENGLTSQGIDQNRHLVDQCLSQGLDVVQADALDFLMDLPPNSVGAVTGLHIIEHIPFERLVRLLDESLRVLRPGGVVAFETPNPENLVVGACNFWYDPTHLHPLPPNISRFLLEARGFVSVEIKRLSENRVVDALDQVPRGQPDAEHLNRIVTYLNKYFAAEPDYAVIGYKA